MKLRSMSVSRCHVTQQTAVGALTGLMATGVTVSPQGLAVTVRDDSCVKEVRQLHGVDSRSLATVCVFFLQIF